MYFARERLDKPSTSCKCPKSPQKPVFFKCNSYLKVDSGTKLYNILDLMYSVN